MLNVTYARHSPHTGESSVTAQVVKAYQSVFGDPPWNEWMRCETCGAFWGFKDRIELESLGFIHCNKKMTEYWPTHQVTEDLEHEIGPDASAWLAFSGDNVIGFCWGYPIEAAELEKKLKVDFADDLLRRFGATRVAYQDELGIVSAFRGQKLAKELFIRRHRDFLAQGLTVGVVRTRRLPEPSVTYLWFTEKLGYVVVAEYDDGRVVLANDIRDLERQV